VAKVLTRPTQSTLLAAAVIGCFSWTPVVGEHWAGPAARYSSLLLALFATLLSSSQAPIFSSFQGPLGTTDLDHVVALLLKVHRDNPGEPTQRPASDPEGGQTTAEATPAHWTPSVVHVRWTMVFVFQAPMMLMAYSMTCFLIGLSLYVCTPLYDGGGFRGESKVSI